MTDEKLDLLLREALQSEEQPPAWIFAKKLARRRWVGAVAACACLALCVSAYFALTPTCEHAASTTETAMQAAEPQAPAMGAAKMESAAEESITIDSGVSDTCGIPTKLDAVVYDWMQENAPNAPYEPLAESERYSSYICRKDSEALYLVIDRQTMEPVSLQELLERGNFKAPEDVNMLYVNQNQELVLVQEGGEVVLGPIE